jgi:hypothetical protein
LAAREMKLVASPDDRGQMGKMELCDEMVAAAAASHHS